MMHTPTVPSHFQARPYRSSALAVSIIFMFAGAALGQADRPDQLVGVDALNPIHRPLEQIPVQIGLDSGTLRAFGAPAAGPELIFETKISVPGSPWIRLQFDQAILSGDPALGKNAFLWITSIADGAVQVMTRQDLDSWQNTSAYFNGDTVRVEVFAYPETGDCRLVIDTVLASPGADPAPLSLCGSDDRVLSNDPRSARILPAQCTGFMIDDQTHNFMTAGHCATGTQVVQFNVPASTEGGALVNPPPEDQYPVDPDSMQWQFSGVGNDWAYFGVFPNSNTGLTPFQAMGAFYPVADAAPTSVNGQVIEITGYGTDSTPPSSNQVQQTSSGPLSTSFGTTVQYQVDTTGGNSGSAVFNTMTGQCIGIHTNAGCSSVGGANSGTAIQQAGLQNALANPRGIAAAPDCNDNGVPDFVDLAQGGLDCNGNGVLDTCESLGLIGDLNGDNVINGVDLAIVLSNWGQNAVPADLNNDGVVNGADLSTLLSNWGSGCASSALRQK